MNNKRIIRLLSLTLVTMLLGLLLLCFTLTGNQLLLGAANKVVPGLNISLSQKSLLAGGDINFDFRSGEIDIRGQSVRLHLTLFDCATLCLSVQGQKLLIHQNMLKQSEPEILNALVEQPKSKRNTELEAQYRMPLTLAISHFLIDEIRYKTNDSAITLDQVRLTANWEQEKVRIDTLLLNSVSIKLPVEERTKHSKKGLSSLPELPSVLPLLPVDLTLAHFTIPLIKIDQGTQHSFSDITGALSMSHRKLRWRDIKVNYGTFILRSNAYFDSTTNGVNVQHFTTISSAEDLLTLKTVGELNHLKFKLGLQGAMAGDVTGHIDLLSKNWPHQLIGQIHQLAPNQFIQNKNVFVHALDFKLSGHAQNYKAILDGQLEVENLGHAALSATVGGSLSGIDITSLDIQIDNAVAGLQGRIDWQSNLAVDVQGVIHSWPFMSALGIPNSDLSGEFTCQITQERGVWQVALPKLSVGGHIEDKTIQMDANWNLNEYGYGEIENLRINYGNSEMSLIGSVADDWDLSGQLRIDHFKSGAIPIDALMEASFLLKGQRDTPHIVLNSDVQHIKGENFFVNQGQLSMDIDLVDQVHGALELEAAELSLLAKKVEDIQLILVGSLTEHTLDFRSKGDLNSEVKIVGSVLNEYWQGALTTANLNYLNVPMTLIASTEARLSQQSVDIASHCWLVNKSKLCGRTSFSRVGEQLAGEAVIRSPYAQLSDLNPFFPEWHITGSGQGALKVVWEDEGVPKIEGDGAFHNIHLSLAGAAHDVILPIDSLTVSTRSTPQDVGFDWRVESSSIGAMTGNVNFPFGRPVSDLKGHMAFERVMMSPLSPFFSEITKQSVTLAGVLTGQLQVAGSSHEPELLGELRFSEFDISSEQSPVNLLDSEIAILLSGQHADISGQLNGLESGQAALEGTIRWSKNLSFDATVKGKQFLLSPRTGVKVAVSPDLSMSFSKHAMSIEGALDVPFGRIDIQSRPKGVVSKSDDEYVIGKTQDDSVIPINYALNLIVSVGDDFHLSALGLEGYLKGELEITKDLLSPILANGELELLGGQYKAFGQDLSIETGKLGFNGTMERPYVNIRAIRNREVTSDEVEVGIDLSGTITQPQFSVFSTPEKPQSEALEYLLYGERIKGQNSDNNVMLAQYLLSQSIGRSEGVIIKAGERLGLDDVSLSAKGRGEKTQVEVSGYLFPDVQVSYRVGVFESLSEVAVRYRVFSKMYVEAISGLYDSIDLLYKFDRGE